MARRRVIDWTKVRRYLKNRAYKLKRRPRPLGWPVKLTWFGILASGDDFGLGDWSPSDIATVFMAEELDAGEITVSEVGEIMERFTQGDDPSVVTWENEDDERTFFALTKWQNYQRTRSPSNADCPCPPPEIFAKLSSSTQRVIRENREKFTSVPEGLFCAEVEEEVEVEDEEDVEGARSRNSAGCPFCRAPTTGSLQWYHDEARRVLNRCLVIPPRKAGPAIARVEKQVGTERAHALFGAYLRSEDLFVLKQGHSLLTFCGEGMQNGLAAALDGGFAHGSKRKPRPRQADNW